MFLHLASVGFATACSLSLYIFSFMYNTNIIITVWYFHHTNRCFVQLTSSILVGKGANAENVKQLSQHLPNFLWLLRDVTLDLPQKGSGGTLTPTEYLREIVLNENRSGETVHTLLHLFPNLKGSMLSPPYMNPQRYPQQNTEFLHQITAEIDSILKAIQPKKCFSGEVVNGPLLVGLIHEYIQAINDPGAIPNLEVSWLNATEQHLRKSCEKFVTGYSAEMEECISGKLPIEEGSLSQDALPPHPETLYGIHFQKFYECLHCLDHEINKLLLPAGSSDLASPEIKKIQNCIRSDFSHRIAMYDDSKKVCRGELYEFVQRNHRESLEYCRKIFNLKYSSMCSCINLEQLTEEYYQEAVGPAKQAAFDEELKRIPGPPLDTTTLNNSSRELTLSWNAPQVHPDSAQHYEIETKEQNSEWTTTRWQTCHVPKYYMSAVVADLKPNTEYSFRIRAKNVMRYGVYCDPVTSKTKAECPNIPPRPEFEQISAKEATITIYPLKPGDGSGVAVSTIILQSAFLGSSQKIQWKEDHISVEKEQFPLKYTIPMESHEDRGEYFFRVKFGNEAGFSEPSDITRKKTKDIFPGKPITTEIICHVTSLTFNWKPPELHSQSVHDYEVKLRQEGEMDWRTTTTSETSYTVKSLQAYTKYEYIIKARNHHLQGEACTDIVLTRAGCPSQPSKPTLRVISSERVEVSIQELKMVKDNGSHVTHVKVEKSHDRKIWTDWDHIDISDNEQIQTKVELCDPNNNDITFLYYRVLVKNEKGWSKPSEVAHLKESDLIPSAPRDIKIVTEKPITVKWNKPLLHASAIKVYSVHVHYEDKKELFDCLSLSYTIENVRSNTSYRIQVQSLNGHREGDYSEAIELTTHCVPPDAPLRRHIAMSVTDNLKLLVELPHLKKGYKPITHIIVETLKNESGWKQESETPVNCSAGGMMSLTTNISEHIRIRLKSDAGISEPSEPVNLPPSSLIPGEPINLQVKECASTSVTLCWEKPQGNEKAAKAYVIESRKEGENQWKGHFSVHEEKTKIDKLDSCSIIEFRVCARNDTKFGKFCDPVKAKTLPMTPGIPGITMISYRSAKLEISKADFDKCTEMNIETCDASRGWKTLTTMKFMDMKTSAETPQKLYCMVEFSGMPLQWKVQMFHGDLKSEYSDYAVLSPDQFIPGAPTALTVVTTSNSAILSWKQPNQGQHPQSVAHYEVLCTADKNPFESQVCQCTTKEYRYEVKNLSMATNYRFRLCAFNKQNRNGEFVYIESKTKCPIPGPPTSLTFTGATSEQVKVRWGPPRQNADAVDEYQLLYRKDDSSFQEFERVPSNKMSAVKYDLEAWTDYDIKVCPINKEGEQGESAVVCATTKHSRKFGITVGVLTALPTLGAGTVAAYFACRGDKDVERDT